MHRLRAEFASLKRGTVEWDGAEGASSSKGASAVVGSLSAQIVAEEIFNPFLEVRSLWEFPGYTGDDQDPAWETFAAANFSHMPVEVWDSSSEASSSPRPKEEDAFCTALRGYETGVRYELERLKAAKGDKAAFRQEAQHYDALRVRPQKVLRGRISGGVIVAFAGIIFDGVHVFSPGGDRFQDLPSTGFTARNLLLAEKVVKEEERPRWGFRESDYAKQKGFDGCASSNGDVKIMAVPRLFSLADHNALNFGHFLTLVLPRLAAVRDQLLTPSSPSSAWILTYDAPFALEVLKLLGVPVEKDRLLLYDPCLAYFTWELLIPGPGEGLFHTVDHVAPESARAVRGMLLPALVPGTAAPATPPVSNEVVAATGDSRAVLLIQRGVAATKSRGRYIENLEDLARAMREELREDAGLDPLPREPFVCEMNSFVDQVRAFRGAALVIGAEGACLANALWMPSGGDIVSLIPANNEYLPGHPVQRCGTNFAWKAADAVGVRARAMLLRDVGLGDQLRIPVGQFRALLQAIYADRRSSITSSSNSSSQLSAAPQHGTTDHTLKSVRKWPPDIGSASVAAMLVDAAEVLSKGRTSAHVAAEHGRADILEELHRNAALEQGVNFVALSPQDAEGRTPMHLAAASGHCRAVKTLLDASAAAATAESEEEPESSSSKKKKKPGQQFRTEDEAKAEVVMAEKDGAGNRPLHIAAHKGFVGVTELLTSPDPDRVVPAGNSGGFRPLHLAAGSGHTAVVEILVQAAGAGALLVANDGQAAEHVAAARGHSAVLRKLADADPKTVTTPALSAMAGKKKGTGRTPLHLASKHGHLIAVETLLTLGAEIRGRTTAGDTAEHLAAHEGHLTVTEALVLARAKVVEEKEPEDGGGLRPLHRATWHGRLSVAAYLVNRGNADLRATQKDGLTPLHLAAVRGFVSLLELFVARGAEVGSRSGGDTGIEPLHLAASGGHLEILERLVELGADPLATDAGGQGAVAYAQDGNHKEKIEPWYEKEKTKRRPPGLVEKVLGIFGIGDGKGRGET